RAYSSIYTLSLHDALPIYHPVKNDKPKVITCNMDYKSNEVNLILSDTYQIESNNLPRKKVNLPTVFIERTVGFSGNRTYSPNFLDRKSTRLNSSHVSISYA